MNDGRGTEIDIVLPCYNPPEGWIDRVIDGYHQLSQGLQGTDVHLIIVNDGSNPPITQADVRQIEENVDKFLWVDQQPNRGKGAALRTGMKHCRSEFIVFTDIDFPYTMDSNIGLCEALLTGEADVVVGQRKKKYYEKTPWQREFISKLLKGINKYILRIPVTDTQCGLKGFNRIGLKAFLDTSVNRYLFDLEFLILAGSRKYNLTVKPFVVELREGVTFSKLNLKILFTESFNIIRIIFKKWFG